MPIFTVALAPEDRQRVDQLITLLTGVLKLIAEKELVLKLKDKKE
jgi:hypothetical protein